MSLQSEHASEQVIAEDFILNPTKLNTIILATKWNIIQ